MKKTVQSFISLLLVFPILISCAATGSVTITDNQDTPATETDNIVDDPMQFGYTPIPDDPHFLYTDEMISDLTIDEKLYILNNLENLDITSVFVFKGGVGYSYYEISKDLYPELFNSVMQIFTDTDGEYTVLEHDIEFDRSQYQFYITFTTSGGDSYTIFQNVYSVPSDEDNGLPNGIKIYDHITFDGDFFSVSATDAYSKLGGLSTELYLEKLITFIQ